MSESQIVSSCLDLLKLKNIFSYRQNSGALKTERGGFIRFGTKGAPDIVAVIKGQYIGIEIKKPKGVQSPGQKEFQKNLEKAGGQYWLIRSVEELLLKIS